MSDFEIEPHEIVFASVEGAKVFHFVQGKADAVLSVCRQAPERDLVLALSYDRPLQTQELGAELAARRIARFWPGSSWAEGRNLGWKVAIGLGEAIDYAAFLDDDAVFEQGDYAGFVAAVLEARPWIAAPVVPRTNRAKYILPGRDIQAGSIQDQQVMLFHRDVLADSLIWPLATEYDAVSWHIPCIIQEYMIFERYKGRLAQFNRFVVRNDGHTWEPGEAVDQGESAYVMERDFHKVRRAAFEDCARRLGKRPDVANDIFGSIKDVTLWERARRVWWKNVGRRRVMGRLAGRP